MKIIFIIGSLAKGGKERRLIELLTFLKKNSSFDLLLILRKEIIDYPVFHELDIPYKTITEKYIKGDLRLFRKFYRICKEFKPDIIHSWGSMPAFVSLPAVRKLKICHINSQITSAPPYMPKLSLMNIMNRLSFRFSDVILSNSHAGLTAYKPPKEKCAVIYNGINLNRFTNLLDIGYIKEKYNIKTPYSVAMVASFSIFKDYNRFIDIAQHVLKLRKDISFICVGSGSNLNSISEKIKDEDNIILTGKIDHVESLVNACDIGVLFSNTSKHGEGISNSILEYMALGKPVIANDAGGTREIVKNNENGYLIKDEKPGEIADLIIDLIDDKAKRESMGNNGRKIIERSFELSHMGREFIELYKKVNNRTHENIDQL